MHGEDCAAIANDHNTHGLALRMNALDNVEVHPASQPTALTRTDEPSIHDVIEPPARDVRDGELVSLTSPNRIGGARRDRTDDLKLAKLALSQLSYGPFGLKAKGAIAQLGER